MNPEQPGIALIICSPSGGGKSTVISRLIRDFSNFSFSVSYTTRKPRPGERHGRDYFFVDPDEFQALVARHFFAEWATVHGKAYGTPLQSSLETLDSGKDMIFDVDVQGARQLQTNISQSVSLFLLPPSKQVLQERLNRRGSEDEHTQNIRLNAAYAEIQSAYDFEYWVLNQDLKTAYEQVKSIYLAEKSRGFRNRPLLETVLKTWDSV